PPGAFPTPARKRDGVRAQVEAQIVAGDGKTEAARPACEVEHALARGGPQRGPHLAERAVSVAEEPTVVEEGAPQERAERRSGDGGHARVRLSGRPCPRQPATAAAAVLVDIARCRPRDPSTSRRCTTSSPASTPSTTTTRGRRCRLDGSSAVGSRSSGRWLG